MIYAKIIVFGQVQGVGYRAHVSNVARQLDIKGRVKNLPDKTVEIECECSDEKKFENFLNLINRKEGSIRVDNIKILEKKPITINKFHWFYIDY